MKYKLFKKTELELDYSNINIFCLYSWSYLFQKPLAGFWKVSNTIPCAFIIFKPKDLLFGLVNAL